MAEYILAHDLGTSGNKATLFATDGTLVGSRTVAYPVYYDKPLWAEQDSNDWWNAVCNSTKELMSAYGVDAEDVKAAPKSHSSASIEYGMGTAKMFGHVKLSDSKSLNYGAETGYAATPKVVKELYDNRLKVASLEVSGEATANTALNLTVDWGKITPLVFFISRVVGSGWTQSITFCEFTVSTNIRVLSTIDQTVTIRASCLYT